MLEHSIRQHYQRVLVNPLLNFLGHYCSPTAITLLAGIVGLLFIPFLLTHHTGWAIGCLLLSGYLDTLDGSVARHQNKTTPLGSVLDIMMDRLVECGILFGFYWANPLQRGLPVIVMLMSCLLCITSFLVVGIFSENNSAKSFHYSPGLIERAEAFIFFVAMVLLPDYFKPLAFLFAGLVLWTALVRVWQFTKNTQRIFCSYDTQKSSSKQKKEGDY